jgi:hypothetical protein
MNPNDLAFLLSRCRTHKLDGEDLDEAVHDVFANAAAEVNNGGLEAQLAVLHENGLGITELVQLIDAIAAEKVQVVS